MERPVDAPAIDFKVVIQRKDLAGLQFAGKMNQASISEIHFAIAIFSKKPLQ
jgi:hypothetical protein